MPNEIRRKPEMTNANPYNDKKFLFCVISPLLFIKNILKNKFKKKNKFNYELICATTKVWRPSEADWEA